MMIKSPSQLLKMILVVSSHWLGERVRSSRPRLVRALWKTFRSELLVTGLLTLVKECILR